MQALVLGPERKKTEMWQEPAGKRVRHHIPEAELLFHLAHRLRREQIRTGHAVASDRQCKRNDVKLSRGLQVFLQGFKRFRIKMRQAVTAQTHQADMRLLICEFIGAEGPKLLLINSP